MCGSSKSFRPWDVGEHTGEPQDSVYKHMERYARETPDKKVPGGESFNAFKTRFLGAIKRVRRDFPGETVAIVTHHRGDRIFPAWKAAGFPDNEDVDLDVFLDPGGIDPGEYGRKTEY